MSTNVETAMLRGRPFGVSLYIKNSKPPELIIVVIVMPL